MKQLHADVPPPVAADPNFSKTNSNSLLGMPPVAPVQAPAIAAAVMATAAHDRNPQYPGYEAVRELYDEYLKLGRQYNDLAAQVEMLKHELQAVRGSVNNG